MAKRSRYNKKKKVGTRTMKRSNHGGVNGEGELVVHRSKKKPHESSMKVRILPSVNRALRSFALINAPSFSLKQNELPMRVSRSHPSGMHGVLSNRLLDGQSIRRNMRQKLEGILASAAMKKLAEQLCVNAENLHANSFTPDIRVDVATQVVECARTNAMAVEQLEKAIGMGSLKARACLADMLLHGNTVGIAKDYVNNFPKAFALVVDIDDDDCKGVLALCCRQFHPLAHAHLNGKSMLDETKRLATKSADAGSKYGHFALGSFEMDPKKAVKHFTVAADKNYDMAQVALSELCMKGECSVVRSPDYKQANDYLHRAAKQGNVRAFELLSNHKVSPQDSGYWASVSSEAKKPIEIPDDAL
jgi:TPR repeat protein